jgi:hypothetical protein
LEHCDEERKGCKKCSEEIIIDETPKLKGCGKGIGINDLDDILSARSVPRAERPGGHREELLTNVKENDLVLRTLRRIRKGSARGIQQAGEATLRDRISPSEKVYQNGRTIKPFHEQTRPRASSR